jgi:4-amino-4-deoxy-L-arabinose transferase-like glycosyltransferase
MGTKTKFFSLTSLTGNNSVLFLLVFAIQFGFKALYINNSGFWYEETFFLSYSEQDWGLIKHTAEWNRNAPLYYYFLNIWSNLFGMGEVAIRLSSVLFSSLAGATFFLLLKKHFSGLAAFIGLILFTFSNQIYFYSQETSVHSLILFLAVASFYLFFNLLDKKSIVSVVLLGICNFLIVYGLYITLVIPIIQVLVMLIFFNKQLLRSIGSSFLITVVLLVLRVTSKTVNCILFSENAGKPEAPSFEYFKNICFLLFNGELFLWIFLGLLVLTIIYLVTGKELIYPEKTKNIKLFSLFLCAIGGIFWCYFFYFLMPGFTISNFIFTLPFLFSIVAIPVSKLNDGIKYALVGATVFISLCFFSTMNLNEKKTMDYRNAMVQIKKLQKPGTLILVETKDIGALFAYYYDETIFKDFNRMEHKLNDKGIYLVSSAEDIKAIDLSKYKRAVLTQTFERTNPGNQKLLDYLASRYLVSFVYGKYTSSEVNIILCGNP